MLNNETKRRIDNCRDILVGKLPDPKSQVEQITIALIYKFMDDMDRESEELGGSPSFFVSDFSRFKWSNVLDLKLDGFKRLNLYAEGIEKMTQNTSIPQLFRDIFKNAYLPYRDPETFSLFAKEINGFNYEHSEELGNAFEYLLSIMSSQGDAGQFRTPRHIIDFIVEIVEPKKNETILDPACGTAGFLISAYKYIQKMNEENGLTPDEHERLTKSITGYDISPDMVRLSLVNLYLHLFPEPRIYEYDTLTSEERWNENYDVILANPPFMTPKGGIKPHSKFAIKANRSEVLFVDYIMEHINLNGRAGVIVPEGIIFQSANAYKSLRKKLIDDKYLWAVVSLPAGVFNPYSGVKTSILLMDREIAKKTDKILFVKVESDGYDLGAQRRENNKSNLPNAVEAIRNYKLRINNVIDKLEGKFFEENCIEVEKAKIGENGDYNLSVDRYRETIVHKHKDWDFVELDKICTEIKNGKNVVQVDEEGKYRVTRIQTIANAEVDLSKTKWTNDEVEENYFMKEGDILLSHINSFEHLGKSAIFSNIREKVVHGINLIRFRLDTSRVNPYFISYLFKSNNFIEKAKSFAQKAVNQASIKTSDLKSIKIPLPPLSVQKEIVEEIEGYQKIIDGARAVVESYKPRIKIDESWEVVTFGKNHLEIIDGDRGVNYPKKEEFFNEGYCLFLSTKNVRDNGFKFEELSFISEEKDKILRNGKIQRNDLVLTTRGTVGNIALYDENVGFENIRINSGMVILRPEKNSLNQRYLYWLIQTDYIKTQFKDIFSGSAQPQLPIKDLKTIKIPLPSIEIQQKIVEEIEEEQKLVEANKRLIEIFEGKIKAKIAEVWGE